MAITGQSAQEKTITLKIVKTAGGYACYHVQTSMHPSAVFTSPFDVLDWLATRLADLEEAKKAGSLGAGSR